MKIYRQILFLATAFVSVACTDSFFDLEPSSSVPTDKVYKTADDFNVAVIGCILNCRDRFPTSRNAANIGVTTCR